MRGHKPTRGRSEGQTRERKVCPWLNYILLALWNRLGESVPFDLMEVRSHFIKFSTTKPILFQAKDLTKDYVKKASVQVQAAEEKLVPVEANLKTAKEAIDWENPWWAIVLSNCKASNNEHDIVQRLKEELRAQFPAHRTKQVSL